MFRHGACTLDCSLGGFGDEAGDLSLHRPGGGQALRVFGGGQGAVPDLHADDGEFLGVPGVVLLCDVQPLPLAAGSDAEAEGGADGRAVAETLGRAVFEGLCGNSGEGIGVSSEDCGGGDGGEW